MAKKPKKLGRPNLYTSRIEPYLDLIAKLRAEGKDDKYIYTLLKVSERTFYTHKSIIDEFSQSYENGNDIVLKKIENSLYELALGKAVKRTSITRTSAEGAISYEEKIEYLPPDKIAAFFVLTNRRGDDWKHKQEVVNPSVDETLEAIKELSDKLDETEWNHT